VAELPDRDPLPHPDGADDELWPQTERALREAGRAWHDAERAESFLAMAADLQPELRAVLIAHYRYFFYRHRFDEALVYGAHLLAQSALRLDLPPRWQDTKAAHLAGAEPEAERRFWMFTLQACGYLLVRCGAREPGRSMLAHLADLDQRNETKTRELLAVFDPACDD